MLGVVVVGEGAGAVVAGQPPSLVGWVSRVHCLLASLTRLELASLGVQHRQGPGSPSGALGISLGALSDGEGLHGRRLEVSGGQSCNGGVSRVYSSLVDSGSKANTLGLGAQYLNILGIVLVP